MVGVVKWRARVLWEFECPKCGLVLAEGNPLACPHRAGEPLYHAEQTPKLSKRHVGTVDDLAKAMDGCQKPGG